jgi:hypothetical protein
MPDLKASLRVVDDQAPIRTCLSDLLTNHSYAVRITPDDFPHWPKSGRSLRILILPDLNMRTRQSLAPAGPSYWLHLLSHPIQHAIAHTPDSAMRATTA